MSAELKESAKKDLNKEKSLDVKIQELERLISYWKTAEKSLEEALKRYQELSETIPDIIYEIDTQGKFVFISDGIRKLGFKPRDLIGKHFRHLIHKDDLEKVSREIVLPKYRGTITGDEKSPKLFDERRTGERMTKYLEVRLTPEKENDAQVKCRCVELHSFGKWSKDMNNKPLQFIGSIGTIRDITKRKEAERDLSRTYNETKRLYEDLELKNKELEKLDREKSDFISYAAHEIRNPVGIVKEAVSIFLEDMSEKLMHQEKDILERAQRQIQRLAGMVDSLLDVSKIEAGRLALYKEFTDINALIINIIKDFKDLTDKRSIKIDSDSEGEKYEIFCDREKIHRVLVNLLSNAVKFSPSSGSIETKVQYRENEVVISVKDKGPGIACENIDKIFDKFSQVLSKATSGIKGTGLGLSISKGIICAHSGNIWAESDLGKGASFYFTLPNLSREEVFKEYLSREIKTAKSEKSCVTVVALIVKDLDAFAAINNKDKAQALSNIIDIIKETLRRKNDIVFSFKERVLLILPDTDKQSAIIVLARAKENIKSNFSKNGYNLEFEDIVISYPGEASDTEDIFKRLKA